MKQKIYIAGCGGMLGEAFHTVFSDQYDLKCTDKDVNTAWLSFCDFTDAAAYRADVESFKPDFLFHLGAITDLEYCEQQPDEAYNNNTLAVETATAIANDLQIPLLYISTAGIFDGTRFLYDDWDTPNPLGHYARSKYLGEVHVQQRANRYIICRAGWMMGGGPQKDKKFIQKLMRQLKQGSKTLHIVNDKDGTPTYTLDFAANVKLLLEEQAWGLYNLVCGGETSRIEVATTLLQLLGLSDTVAVEEVPSDYFAQTYFAPRPPNERLVNYKLNLKGLNRMRNWKEALKEYLDTAYTGYL